MSEISTIGLDLAKTTSQLHGADAQGHAVLRKKLRRSQLLDFFGRLGPCAFAMEACGGAHLFEACAEELARVLWTNHAIL